MKKILFPILFLILFSCNNKDEKLVAEIAELKAKNKKLEETLDYRKSKEIENLQMLLEPKTKIKFRNGNKISGSFTRFEKIPEYNLYVIDNITKQKTLVAKNLTEPNFNFDFKPKTEKDSLLRVITEMKIDGKTIEMFGRLDFVVEK
ncbi:hypothetical protein [Flavobacterium sp. 5]|uniref:hypothetical protein n=1 Tax=Flavobacterium sp. 5 TaxID=2035199 RepID=UPI000C2BB1FE|nr:hypothetical protein [Flavobacterium sp. 5]PKB15275.1 hypothetical protein CLU82_0339 [Flavobacterium sp. 5]